MNHKNARITAFLFFLAAFCVATSFAQEGRIEITHLDRLEARASNVVNVTIDERWMKIASKFLSNKDPDEAKIKELVAGLKGVYVKSFEFDKDNEYTQEDVRVITSQLDSSQWSKMVNVKSKKDGQVVEVYTILDGNSNIRGLAVLSVEPRQLTVVNIVGPIDIDKLASLSGSLGIPKLDIEQTPKTKKD
jgi:hypothetical protein